MYTTYNIISNVKPENYALSHCETWNCNGIVYVIYVCMYVVCMLKRIGGGNP